MFCSEFLIYFKLDVFVQEVLYGKTCENDTHIYTVRKNVRPYICECTNTVSV